MAETTDFSNRDDDFAEMLADHQGRLYGFIRSLMGADAGVEDVLQNTNRVLWEKASTFTPGTNFRAWAFQIARYQVLQFRAKQQREGIMIPFSSELLESLAVFAGEKESAYERRRKFLKMCLDKMPPRQREVIEKRYFERQSVASISTGLGIKPNAVSQLLFRGRENLLHCIESQMPGDGSINSSEF